MRLTIRKGGNLVTELTFPAGPVHIGRAETNQVVLPDRAVSRQHALLFKSADRIWLVRDLDSANKTHLNEKIIDQAPLHSGDHLRIADFVIDIDLSDEQPGRHQIHLEDTLAPDTSTPQLITRKPTLETAPDIVLPAKRARDYLRATEAVCRCDTPDKILQTLLDILIMQFDAHRVWGALRNEPEGPMKMHAGRTKHHQPVVADEIEHREDISRAVDKQIFLLLPQVRGRAAQVPIASAMIAPVTDLTGCFGVLYLDNIAPSRNYTLSDLDYLMLLSIHAAVIVENF